MSHFGTLYLYELKKIGKRKMVWITMAVVIAFAIFVGCGDIFSYISITTGQETVYMSGLEYQRYEKETKEKLSGRPIDDAMLAETREAYQKDNGMENTTSYSQVAGSFDEDMTKMEELVRKREQYGVIYSYVNSIKGYYETIHTIDEKKLYQTRYEKIQEIWEEFGLTQGEKEYWEEKEQRIEKPFIYGYAEGWFGIVADMLSLNFMQGLAIAICLANVFSEEHSRKTDQLILCSRHGKKLCYCAKMAAGVTFGVVCGGIILLMTGIISLAIYGTEGADTMIQILWPLCSRDMTVGQAVLMISMVYAVISILWSILTLFLSEAMKNGVAVMGIMSGGLFFSTILSVPYSFRSISQIFDLFPTRLLTPWSLWDNRLVRIFGRYFSNFEIAPIIYFAVSIILVFWGRRIYQKYQVSGR